MLDKCGSLAKLCVISKKNIKLIFCFYASGLLFLIHFFQGYRSDRQINYPKKKGKKKGQAVDMGKLIIVNMCLLVV